MTSYQIDTNALLRFLTGDIPVQQAQVEKLINSSRKHLVNLHVCEPVFIETAVMLRNYYKYPRQQIVNLLTVLLNSPELIIENRKLLIKSLDTYAENSIDFVDSVLLVRTESHKHRLFTFDHHLTNLTP